MGNSAEINVDALIKLIRDGRDSAALEALEVSPELACQHPDSGELHGASPLHWTAHRNSLEVCQKLIQLGADVNDSAGDWWLTPLAWGADAASTEAVQLLLENGADVDQDAIVGNTALHAVAMGGSTQGKGAPDSYAATAKTLIDHGADVTQKSDCGATPLDEALKNENHAVIQILQS